ncbi:hypothetical protein PMAYCL1PPCAC_22162, partial [Pristionchus mayeri]
LSASSVPISSDLQIKFIELVTAENPKTDADMARVGCIAALCHFEDKDGCKQKCADLTKNFALKFGSIVFFPR